MAEKTINELDTVSTSAAAAAGLSAINFEVQITGLSDPESRQMTEQQILDVAKAVRAVSSGTILASGSASITGSSAINTGLGLVTRAFLTIRGVLGSSSAAVSWSALASSGYFNACVFANPVSSSSAPALSSVPVTVDWICVGTE